MAEDENSVLKRQLEELREQLNHKDLDLKSYHRTISDLEQQIAQAENVCNRTNFLFIFISANSRLVYLIRVFSLSEYFSYLRQKSDKMKNFVMPIDRHCSIRKKTKKSRPI